jgi:hypothetical protein
VGEVEGGAGMSAADVALTSKWAGLYRERGYNPLPSRPDAKRPFVKYADAWEAPEPLSAAEFDRWGATSLQLMCGRRWRLLVIDLDGPEARERWAKLGRTPATWVTHSGGNGHHVWFSIESGPDLPKAFLWKGDGNHSAIERLCDRSLVMAPPSIHPKTGERYRFADKWHSPAKLPMPAPVPAWVLRLEPITTRPEAPPVFVGSVPRPTARAKAGGPRFHRADVLAAIPDKAALAASWGLRLAGRPTPKGWVPCHAVGREDTRASAAIHRESGTYVDRGTDLRLSLFDLAAQLGVYADGRDAISDLGERFHVSRSA